MDRIIGMPDSALPGDHSALTEKERAIYHKILQEWPTTALEIAAHYHTLPETRDEKRRLSTKYSYYIKKLVAKRFVLSKKSGNATIVWPLSVEKYRAMHSTLGE